METYELRYFNAVAATQNVHRAAEALSVSPGSLSKAISRLEDELGVKLFDRIRRNIRLTSDGRILQERAAAILQLEEATRIELQGGHASFQVRLVGPEILLARVGPTLARDVRRDFPKARFNFQARTEHEVECAITSGDAHIGLTTGDIPHGVTSKRLFDVAFQTCVGRGHPLFKHAKAGAVVPVAQVLQHAFVSPDRPIMGLIGKRQSPDGWRDDKFPRRIDYVAGSLQLLEELVVHGDAVAYLPDYYAQQIPVAVLQISGCPYSCTQTAKLIARAPEQAAWLRRLFD